MDDNFMKYWFGGFESALKRVDEKSREVLLKECGKACSSSYTRQIYIDEFKASCSISDFLDRLKKRFPELQIELNNENRELIFIYTHCSCDLVTMGYIKTDLLCDCSRLSLQDNWEAVIGPGNVEVTLLKSILSGHDCCKFRVNIKAGTS